MIAAAARKCNKCGLEKPVSEFYDKPKTKCKECCKAASRESYQKSGEQKREYARRYSRFYYHENREQIRNRRRATTGTVCHRCGKSGVEFYQSDSYWCKLCHKAKNGELSEPRRNARLRRLARLSIRQCPTCGAPFVWHPGHQAKEFCSLPCLREAMQQTQYCGVCRIVCGVVGDERVFCSKECERSFLSMPQSGWSAALHPRRRRHKESQQLDRSYGKTWRVAMHKARRRFASREMSRDKHAHPWARCMSTLSSSLLCRVKRLDAKNEMPTRRRKTKGFSDWKEALECQEQLARTRYTQQVRRWINPWNSVFESKIKLMASRRPNDNRTTDYR